MFEKSDNNITKKIPNLSELSLEEIGLRSECDKLVYRARESKDVDTLSYQERERLVQLGHHFLEINGNDYRAINAFMASNEFGEIRKIADQFINEQLHESYDLSRMLIWLEDYEGIQNLLNNTDDKNKEFILNKVANSTVSSGILGEPLIKYKDNFLRENGTPIATGGLNEVDLVAIHNLAKQYDIAVPIARGGLKQGAIAKLWEMPIKIVDIAAHNRKVPRGKWIGSVSKNDFANKRVLLFDKDAVSGSSIRKTVEMLSKFQPASIGVYFTHNITSKESPGFTRTEGLPQGLEIFCPKNAPLQNAGDIYIEAHERLGTLYGRRRETEHLFTKEAQKLKKQYPDLSESLEIFISEKLRVFDSLNPYLPGVLSVRERILSEATSIYRQHQDNLKLNVYSVPAALANFKGILSTAQSLPYEFEKDLFEARYKKQIEEAAKKRGIENIHYPSEPLAAFDAARMAIKKGFDIALIVGPEGFSYEPFFRDLGLPTVAVNIPEYRENEVRTVKLLDDLSVLQNKKVLVVEDDVRTGATLQKLIEQMKPHMPAQLGLYLGLPKDFQKTASIPSDFTETFMTKKEIGLNIAGKNFLEYLESRGLKIFKTTKVSGDNQ